MATGGSTPDSLTLANLDIATGDSTPDSLALAERDREIQGPREAKYSYGDEVNLHRHYDSCIKNPGHENFIPIDKFNIKNLPTDYQDLDLVNYIRGISYLTVHVKVGYVSERRPVTDPGSGKPYPRHNVRGMKSISLGTGYVNSVEISEHIKEVYCKCKKCRSSSTVVKDFATFTIHTATHVVFDELEGQHTTCHLFFDRGDTPSTCPGVVTLKGMSDVSSDIITDVCYMKHYTHDLALACQLREKVKETEKMCELMFKMGNSYGLRQTQVDTYTQPLLFIVSHPHGCSKQVSQGRWTRVEMLSSDIVNLFYNTATCPGSSGAPTFVLFADTGSDSMWRAFRGVHRGKSTLLPGFSYGCIEGGLEPRRDVVKEAMLLNTGAWKDNLFSVDEEEARENYAACKTNPGHKNCFPIEKFDMDNLPPVYRKVNVMNFAKLLSALTVRVSVNYVSPERPETVPGTETPYPLSNNKGSKHMRVGNGWIQDTKKNAEACCCPECKKSPKPKRFGFIHIITKARLVYNEQEKEHTTCHIFYDSDEMPNVRRGCFALKDILYINNEITDDICSLKYYTHDTELIDDLSKIKKDYKRTNSLICKDLRESQNYVKENSGQNAKQETPLEIMVSHPHGCSKHVNIGYRGNPGGVDSLYPQTIIYCPGSIGAPERTLGWQLFYPYLC